MPLPLGGHAYRDVDLAARIDADLSALVGADPGALHVARDTETDPLERRQPEPPVAQLRAETRICAQRGRRAGQNAEEVGQLTPTRKGAAQYRRGPLGGSQLVVYLKSAHGRFHL